jgi:putative intracellular protease/amidase
VRWLYHITPRGTDLGDRYAPATLVIEGFVHCSFRDEVRESALLYFPHDLELEVLRIDPRRLDAPVELATSPRGPMPHVRGAIPRDAIAEVLHLDHVAAAPDRVAGTRFGFVAFDGMTLLDLVGVLDPIGRIASMGFDPSSRTTVISAAGERVWTCDGAALVVERVRPPLEDFDVLVIPGGFGTRTLVEDSALAAWLDGFPHNRLIASVCTGSLLLGAAGRLRGRRATTHRSAMPELGRYGATPVNARVVDEGQLVTASGVSCAIDLGIHLVRRLEGDEAADKIAAQMHLPDGFTASSRA